MQVLKTKINLIRNTIFVLSIKTQQFFPYNYESNMNSYDPSFEKYNKSLLSPKTIEKENSSESNDYNDESEEVKGYNDEILNNGNKDNSNYNLYPTKYPETLDNFYKNNDEIESKEADDSSATQIRSKPKRIIISAITGNPNLRYLANRYMALNKNLRNVANGQLFNDDIYNPAFFENREHGNESYSDSSNTSYFPTKKGVRSFTKGKIQTSQQNLGSVLKHELHDVSKDMSSKVQAAIGNVSKSAPQNFKEVIIIKKRILTNGKQKMINLNVQKKVVPKEKAKIEAVGTKSALNDFGVRAVAGGLLFLIAGLLFTSTVKFYQNWMRKKYIKIQDKNEKVKINENEFYN